MNFKLKAVVLRKKSYQENQIYLNILTAERGILNVKLKQRGEITKSVISNVCVGDLYEFSLYSGKFGIVIDYIESLESFFKLRYFPDRFALCQYFCELSYYLLLSVKKPLKHFNLLLNSIWLLKNENFYPEFIKGVFEFRIISICGYMPNLVGCRFCYSYEKEVMFFSYKDGFLTCGDCAKKKENFKDLIKLSKAVLYAMRYVIYKKDKDIFKFKLNKEELKLFCEIAEKNVFMCIGKELITLKIYKDLI